jgi:hypothetical protein
MIKMKKIYGLLLSCLVLQGLSAQTVRNITVSQDTAYTDHISLEVDSRDKDVMVKFVFDEAANTLTVNLISYRTMFVFREDVRFKPTIKGRTLRPDQLPYVVTFDPSEKYTISKLFKSTVPRPRKKYVFKRWVDYEGLQPAPQEYAMVNDYVSQTFDILGKRNQVKVTLRDIMLMDDISKHPNKKRYEISYGRDMFREYNIQILRNPCFGLDEDMAAAKKAEEAVKNAYASIKGKFGKGEVGSQEILASFKDMQAMLLTQYPAKELKSDCPDFQSVWDSYNTYVDSIASMRCVIAATSVNGGITVGQEGVSAKLLHNRARQIDAMVTRWLISNDPIERRDIVKQCDSIIQGVKDLLTRQGGVRTSEQQRALEVFREAEQYYRLKCRK